MHLSMSSPTPLHLGIGWDLHSKDAKIFLQIPTQSLYIFTIAKTPLVNKTLEKTHKFPSLPGWEVVGSDIDRCINIMH